jgi:hypothetical protein
MLTRLVSVLEAELCALVTILQTGNGGSVAISRRDRR